MSVFFDMEHRIDISYTARYFSHGNPAAKNLLVALHGYGQLAAYFIRKFEFLDPEKYYVIVPEGLHRFYLNGSDGRVGASWMTKEDREQDIANYTRYLDSLLRDLTKDKTYEKKILLGFSQGGATASRSITAIAASGLVVDAFILWAAVFPPDMKKEDRVHFASSKNYFVVGTADEYYTPETILKAGQTLKDSGINFELLKFEGGHAIDPITLQEILNAI